MPVYRGGRLIVADASLRRKVAGISLPAFGMSGLRRKVREAILQLVCELHAGSNSPGETPDCLVSRRFTEFVIPMKRAAPPDVDVRFVSPLKRGHLRLLAGMVLANRPWKILPSFKSVLAAAFATGAYVFVTPTIWQFGDTFGWPRLLALMVISIAAMVAWLIVSHGLWEQAADRENKANAGLYNAATALTITVAVVFSYAVLFLLILAAAVVFVQGGFLRSTLGHPVGVSDYLSLAWITASLATVAGTLGSGLEDEETVRKATYGHRRRSRYGEPDSE